jgi:FkbM family methyltransferase
MPPTRVHASGTSFVIEPNGQDAFWTLFDDGGWEVSTLEAIRALVQAATLYVDVGAWVGPTVLVAAAAGARRIVAYEPDPVARNDLLQNLDLNPALSRCVTVRPVALARRDGVATLSSQALGDSMASLVRAGNETTTVTTVHAEKALRLVGVDSDTVIKMDVEGAEFDLLWTLRPLLRDARPTLIVSWHYFHVLENRRFLQARVINLREKRKVARTLLLYPHWYRPSEASWREMKLREKLRFFLRMHQTVILFAQRPQQLP